MIATPAAVLPVAAAVIAQATPGPGPAPPPVTPPGTERGEEFGKTSPIALVVILLLLLATVLLIRSMSKRLRNIPASFDDAVPREVAVPGGEGASEAGVADGDDDERGGRDARGPAGGSPPGS